MKAELPVPSRLMNGSLTTGKTTQGAEKSPAIS